MSFFRKISVAFRTAKQVEIYSSFPSLTFSFFIEWPSEISRDRKDTCDVQDVISMSRSIETASDYWRSRRFIMRFEHGKNSHTVIKSRARAFPCPWSSSQKKKRKDRRISVMRGVHGRRRHLAQIPLHFCRTSLHQRRNKNVMRDMSASICEDTEDIAIVKCASMQKCAHANKSDCAALGLALINFDPSISRVFISELLGARQGGFNNFLYRARTVENYFYLALAPQRSAPVLEIKSNVSQIAFPRISSLLTCWLEIAVWSERYVTVQISF